MILNVNVVNKLATFQKRGGCIVCGNSDYQIQFSFDREWDAYDKKTARFISNGQFTDIDFDKTKNNNICNVPILHDTTEVEVGVYAGELKTTTSAFIECYRSILCMATTPSEENDRLYINEAKEAADRAEESAKLAEEYAGKVIIEGGGISAEVDRRLTDLEAAVEAINEKLNYEKISFKSFSVVEPSTTEFEYGDTVSKIKLAWELNKTAKKITVNGKTLEDPTVTEYEENGPFTETKTWEVIVTDEKGATARMTKSINFKYETIKFNSFTMTPSGTEYEYGNAPASIRFDWTLSRAATSITVNNTSIGATATYHTVNGPFTEDQEWTVVATDAKGGTAPKTKSIDIKYRVYWGLGTQDAGFDSAFVTGLREQGTELTTSKDRTLTFNSINNQYVYYAYPEDFGVAKFQIGEVPIPGGFEPAKRIEVNTGFTDADNNPIKLYYYLYRSAELLEPVGAVNIYVS